MVRHKRIHARVLQIGAVSATIRGMEPSWWSAPYPPGFAAGTLLARTMAVTEQARLNHTLQPIATRSFTVTENGIPFLVRMLVRTGGDAATHQQPAQPSRADPPPANPFLPYDPELFVAELSPTHVCLLNKFTVLDNHLLIVTRDFEAQEAVLSVADFAALWVCLDEIDGLGFYNAGKVAGASQGHKHVQLAPFPLGPDGIRLPIERAFGSTALPDGLATVAGLPFAHTLAPIDRHAWTTLEAAARATHAIYLAMLNAVGNGLGGADDAPPPYNLLVTRQWMLLVPRTREAFDAMSVNALGFAGCLLVRNEAQLQELTSGRPIGGVAPRGQAAVPTSRQGRLKADMGINIAWCEPFLHCAGCCRLTNPRQTGPRQNWRPRPWPTTVGISRSTWATAPHFGSG